MIYLSCIREKQVRDLTDPNLILITDSQDIEEVKKYLGSPEWFDYGCLFVSIKDGEYDQIYGCENSVPYSDQWVDTIRVISYCRYLFNLQYSRTNKKTISPKHEPSINELIGYQTSRITDYSQ